MARKLTMCKLNPKVVAFSLAGVSAILSLLCALLVAVAPDVTLKFFGSIFHGVDISKIAQTSVTASGVLTGLVAAAVAAFAAGWIFAVVYNYFADKMK